MGCSERVSTAPASCRISSRPVSGEKTSTSLTPNSPVVRVPVLSKSTARILRAPSNGVLLRIKNPFFAARVVETATTRGTARPRACGQVITITVTVRSMEKRKSRPEKASQANMVIAPEPMAIKVSHMAAVLARSWDLDLLSWASRTRFITWFKKESPPVLVTRKVRDPSPFTAPPMTSSPGLFLTGLDSPVSRASFTEESPSVTSPSAGIFSPGRTRTLSPFASSLTETSETSPRSSSLCACPGIRRASFSRAPEALITERISIQCPRSMIAISVASSQKKTFPGRPRATRLE